MRIVVVTFPNSEKRYEYKTEAQLVVGGQYKIVADGVTSYRSPVTVVGYRKNQYFEGNLRTITNAVCVSAPPAPDSNIEKVIFNEEKRTTVVIWKDGIKTKIKCSESDEFDREKAIALCYMKRAFNNRGCFNNVFKEWI